ncbi:auxilin-related protein 2-like isoform X2 [Wolffia australiana]
MDEFPGLLRRDFGLRPQGKAAPMATAKNSTGSTSIFHSDAGDRKNIGKFQRESDDFFSSVDPLFGIGQTRGNPPPVFDKPVYDEEEDIFRGIPGLKKGGTTAKNDDLFAGLGGSGINGIGGRSASINVKSRSDDDDVFAGVGGRSTGASYNDDLLAGLGGGKGFDQKKGSGFNSSRSPPSYEDDFLGGFGSQSSRETRLPKEDFVSGFDDLIPGFGGGGRSDQKSGLSDNKHQSSVSSEKASASTVEDPFAVFASAAATKFEDSSAKNDETRDLSGFDDFIKPKGPSSSHTGKNKVSEPIFSNSVHVDSSSEPSKPVHKRVDPNYQDTSHVLKTDEENPDIDDDLWVTVSEIQLFTPFTTAPPPSRPPPPATFRPSSKDPRGRGTVNEKLSSQGAPVSSWDERDDFAMGNPPYGSEEGIGGNSAAAAMKEAVDKAEAKFKHARERDLKERKRKDEREENEKEKERLDQEREMEQQRLEKMREKEAERERERGRQAVERATREARERAAAEARQKADRTAREQAERAAVQRAQSEARERAAQEAKERAERLAAERERAATEARDRAEAEARERAVAESREKASRERAAREKAAVERAAAEARARAQRAAVERVAAEARERAAAEARERAAAEARERAAAAAREKQQRSNENDLDSFFGMGSRATSAPKERSTPTESVFEAQFTSQGGSGRSQKPTAPSGMRRPSSTTNIMDDLTSVFSGNSGDEFQEIPGESEERRRARLEREQRTRQRTAKALAEKNERELQVQREQAERDRISDTLNIEIKRWAAGKEGNLRALLSTLQYVLWPGSGWQPVSLTDLITGASVKKVYRKATLCVHPDKVVSGTVQQKYIAEKVFDLLKEAWNKFNSEELF